MLSYPDLPPVVISAGDRNRLQAIAQSFLEQSHPLAAPILQNSSVRNCAILRQSRQTQFRSTASSLTGR